MLPVLRERQEREEAEREGRPIQEEEPEEENMHSPFQPISNVISVVREAFLNPVVNCSPEKKRERLCLVFVFHLRTRIKRRKGGARKSCSRPTA